MPETLSYLVQQYTVDVDYPEVSGIEHLQMLERRSQLHRVEAQLSADERHWLAVADHKLATQALYFLQELTHFANLAEERRQRSISPEEWWWYLDVLVLAPALPHRSAETGLVLV